MDRLRPRQREVFPIFTKAEIEKMENLLEQSREPTLDEEFCKKLTLSFNRSQGRVGKPILKWNQVHSWFLNRQEDFPHKDSLADAPKRLPVIPETCPPCKAKESSEMSEGEKVPDLSELEFEARSSKDAAWYDVDTFISHRFLASGEAEVRVRYVGFGADEDEWVNVKKAVRERSVPMEHSECHKVGVGDLVVCFQEKGDQARYYDAYVLEIQRKLHDIRGCRCLFLIRYDHDNTEERVRLRRLCCRPIEVLAH